MKYGAFHLLLLMILSTNLLQQFLAQIIMKINMQNGFQSQCRPILEYKS